MVPEGQIDSNLALAQIMARRQIGDKSISKPMFTRFIYAYMWH